MIKRHLNKSQVKKRHLTKSHRELHSSITSSSCKIYQYSVHEEKAFLKNKKWKRKWKLWHLRENFSLIRIPCLQQKMDTLFWKLENFLLPCFTDPQKFSLVNAPGKCDSVFGCILLHPIENHTHRKKTFHFSMGNDP